MKIQNSLSEINNNKAKHNTEMQQQPLYTPTFRAGFAGALNLFGSTMQGIENGGFLASFLIQDLLGMTTPRVGAAFLRDKDITGHYNIQEGFEVLGREGLTGPCMMAVAPIMFALAAKCGRTTGVNSQLIKRYGNSLRELIAKPNFDKAILTSKDKFRQEFYAANIRDMLANTVGKENVSEKSVKFILDEMSKYQNIPADAKLRGIFKKKNYRKDRLAAISEHVNNIKYSTSSELSMLDKVRLGSSKHNDIRTFSTKDAIEGLMKYADDAIILNKNLNKMDEIMAESIKDTSIAKRFITNISTMAATLGVLSVLPKIYAKSSVSPGARTAMELKEKAKAQDTENQTKDVKNSEVTFKGKGGKPNKSLLSKIGEFLSKFMDKEFVGRELEYNGHDFTNTLMAGLSLFGLLAPRGLRAYNRAQVDEDGKKDLTELWEILIRDVSSSLSVVFAVPMLTRAFVTSYEDKSGFVLMHKDRSKSKLATAFDLINPYSQAHVLKNSEITSLYGNIDSQAKMLNFCKYIDNNGGDLQKILSKSEHVNLLEEKGLKLSELANLAKKDKNRKITEFVEKLGKESDEIISKVMSANKPKGNTIRAFARNLNSIPGVITTFLISPYLLGWVIPRLTYANTRRIHEKKEQERAQKINTAA